MLLRIAAKQLGVPDSVTSTKDKRGFASPVPSWLEGELASWCDEILDAALAAPMPPVLADLLQRGRSRRLAQKFDRTRMMALMWAIWYGSVG